MRRELTRDQQVEVAELERPQRPVGPSQRDAVRPRIRGVSVLGALRVVELPGVGRGEDVVVRLAHLAEVDRGSRQVEAPLRRHVALHVVRQPLADHGVDRAGRDAIAVCVLEMLVDPVLRGLRQLCEVELAGAELQRLVLVADCVTVDVDVDEVVVGPDGLLLLVRVLERSKVPQSQVVHGHRVRLHLLSGERLVAVEVADCHASQAVRLTGPRDLALDVGQLVRLRVRRDEEALDDGGIDLPQQEHRDPDHGRTDGEPQPADPDVGQHRARRDHAGAGLESHHRKARIHVGVRGAPHNVGVVGIEKVVATKPEQGGKRCREESEAGRDMRDGQRAEVERKRIASPGVQRSDQKRAHEGEPESPAHD